MYIIVRWLGEGVEIGSDFFTYQHVVEVKIEV